jgi:peptidyl-prolyl cis-trans isomerase C
MAYRHSMLTVVSAITSLAIAPSTFAQFDSKAIAKSDVSSATSPAAASIATPDFEFVASVNGAPITQGLMNLTLRAAVNQGQRDSPELRQTIKNDLINKELVAQEATRLGLANGIDFPDHIAQLRQNLLLQAFLENHFKKNPITEVQLREEYDRQRKLMGDTSNAFQYRVSQIVVSTETDAMDLIRRLQKGDLFGRLAQEFSIDPASRPQGGSLGWIMTGQVIPAVASVLPTMTKGGITPKPIQTPAGWVILKLDDKRSFKIPTFEESKPQLQQALIQQYLSQAIQGLRSNAKIVQ